MTIFIVMLFILKISLIYSDKLKNRIIIKNVKSYRHT